MLSHEFCLLLQGLVKLGIEHLLFFLLLLLLLLHSALFLFLVPLLQPTILLLNKGNISKQPVHQFADITILILPSLSPHDLHHFPLDLLSEASDLLLMLIDTDYFSEVDDG